MMLFQTVVVTDPKVFEQIKKHSEEGLLTENLKNAHAHLRMIGIIVRKLDQDLVYPSVE